MTEGDSASTSPRQPRQDSAREHFFVPTYVRELCELAARSGLVVGPLGVRPAAESAPARLVCTWTGSREQFARTGLFTTYQRSPFATRGNARRFVTVPATEGPWGNPLVFGDLTQCGDTLTYEAAFNCVAATMETHGDVERLNLGKETLWYGTAAALAACGIDPQRLPTGLRPAKSHWHPVDVPAPRWRSRRLPWGTFLYREESATAIAIRLRHWREQDRVADTLSQLSLLDCLLGLGRSSPPRTHRTSYIRLVVDNTERPTRRTLPGSH